MTDGGGFGENKDDLNGEGMSSTSDGMQTWPWLGELVVLAGSDTVGYIHVAMDIISSLGEYLHVSMAFVRSHDVSI